MEIHYFQRYHQPENVATANTMLLLSRFYAYSPEKIYYFLKSVYFSDSFDPEICFALQEKNDISIPDATIRQNSFKIVIETKMGEQFDYDQLRRHLEAFGSEEYKVLITLAPKQMTDNESEAIKDLLSDYNSIKEEEDNRIRDILPEYKNRQPIIYINTTFARIADSINDIIDGNDIEMKQILDDYYQYCSYDGLIPQSESWKYLKIYTSRRKLEFFQKENVCYDAAYYGYCAHDTIGLYKDKCVYAIGKVISVITAIETENGIEYETEIGELTEAMKNTISRTMSFGDFLGDNLRTCKQRFFFVDRFYETDFRKISSGGLSFPKLFDLTKIIGNEQLPDNTKELAELLSNEKWV